MAADPPLLGSEGSVLQTELLSALEKVPKSASNAQSELCSNIVGSYQDKSRYTLTRYKDNYPFTCYRFLQIDDPKKKVTAIRSHVLSGFALTDYYCDTFFDRIAVHHAKRRFSRSGINDVGAAVTAVLGLATASSAITGGVGAGFGLLDSSFRNYDEAFLVDADLPALQRLVRSEQTAIRTSLFSGANISTFPGSFQESTIAILRYANTCSFTGMRGLLTASMIEKAEAARNPLDGSRIRNPLNLTLEQRKALITLLQAENAAEEPVSTDPSVDP